MQSSYLKRMLDRQKSTFVFRTDSFFDVLFLSCWFSWTFSPFWARQICQSANIAEPPGTTAPVPLPFPRKISTHRLFPASKNKNQPGESIGKRIRHWCVFLVGTSVRTTLFPSEQDLPQRANRRRFFVETPIGCYPRGLRHVELPPVSVYQWGPCQPTPADPSILLPPECFQSKASWLDPQCCPGCPVGHRLERELESQWNRDPGNVQLWAALSLAFALALKSKPQPRRCGGTTEASCKTSSKGSQALEASSCHNCRASCPAQSEKARHFRQEKLPTPHHHPSSHFQPLEKNSRHPTTWWLPTQKKPETRALTRTLPPSQGANP